MSSSQHVLCSCCPVSSHSHLRASLSGLCIHCSDPGSVHTKHIRRGAKQVSYTYQTKECWFLAGHQSSCILRCIHFYCIEFLLSGLHFPSCISKVFFCFCSWEEILRNNAIIVNHLTCKWYCTEVFLLLLCTVQLFVWIDSTVDPCKWHCNLQPALMGKVMKRGLQNVIRLLSDACIIITGWSKLTDSQPDRENTAGNKYQTVYKY